MQGLSRAHCADDQVEAGAPTAAAAEREREGRPIVRFVCGESALAKRDRLMNWHLWFAWHPVVVQEENGRKVWAWFEYVERKSNQWIWCEYQNYEYRPRGVSLRSRG